MSKTRNLLIGLAGGAIFLYGAASFAQPPGPQGPGPAAQQGGPGGPGGRGGRGGDPALRNQMIHQRLAITPAQESAFNAWIAATQPPAGPPPADQGLTTPQRLDRQLAQLQARVTATKTFYAGLTTQQKQTFDALPPEIALGGPAPGRGGAGPGGRAGRGGGRRGGAGGPPPANGGYNPQ